MRSFPKTALSPRSADWVLVRQNNAQRWRCYKHCAALLDYTYREPLPDCVVACIRNAWPASDGIYTGYKGTMHDSDSSDSDDDSDGDDPDV